MAFVERGPDGRYPERSENTRRVWLEDIWRRLVECEETYDQVALDRARRDASAAMNQAVDHALNRVGMSAVADVMHTVDFRGWH